VVLAASKAKNQIPPTPLKKGGLFNQYFLISMDITVLRGTGNRRRFLLT
jgi:hypothetical protein